jgi:thiol-disulfide isomerase/thioredoxin
MPWLAWLLLAQIPGKFEQVVDEQAWQEFRAVLLGQNSSIYELELEFIKQDLGPISGKESYRLLVGQERFALIPSQADGLWVLADGSKLTRILPSLRQYKRGEKPASQQEAWLGDSSFQDMSAGMVGFVGLFFSRMEPDLWREDLQHLQRQESPQEGRTRFHMVLAGMNLYVELAGPDQHIALIDMPMRHYLKPSNKPRPEPRISLLCSGRKQLTGEPLVPEPPNLEDYSEVEKFGPPVEDVVAVAAPDFTLNDLMGPAFHLQDLRGKVVVLDFWATWCGPCRAIMPVIADLAAKYNPGGKVFITSINLREDAEKVRSFLASRGLELPTLLDSEGKVGLAYQAQAIPLTVVIAPDGTIYKTHKGAGPGYRFTLEQEIETLLRLAAN